MLEPTSGLWEAAFDVLTVAVVLVVGCVAGYMAGYGFGRLVRRFTTEMPVIHLDDDPDDGDRTPARPRR